MHCIGFDTTLPQPLRTYKAVYTLKLFNLRGVSAGRLEPTKNQLPSPRRTRSVSRQKQQSSPGSSRRDQDRSGEQETASSQCCPVPAVTCSSSPQLSQAAAAISIPVSVPGVEILNFEPPTHPSVSPNTGRLHFPGYSPYPSPASSLSLLFTEFSEPSNLFQYSPVPLPKKTLPASVVNYSPPARPQSAPTSPAPSRSLLPRFPNHQRRQFPFPAKSTSFNTLHQCQHSPFLGVAGQSNYSLDWDNYASDPSFLHKLAKIPVINTPSSSLDPLSPDRLCEFPSSPLCPPAMATPQQMAADSRKLQLSKHSVEILIKSFPAELMTLDTGLLQCRTEGDQGQVP